MTFSKSRFDFVDCIILARKKHLGEDVFTFDKKLANRLKAEEFDKEDSNERK